MANMILHVDAVLELLKVADLDNLTESEQKIGARFLSRFPHDGQVLEKYRKKPGCGTCRKGMKTLIVDNPANVNAMLIEIYDGDNAKVQENFFLTKAEYEDYNRRKAAAKKRVDVNVVTAAGQVHDIPDTPEAYAGLLREVRDRRGRYAGLTVRELEPGKIRVYFY